ncbi:ATP-dependent DNA ligase [Streptomyces sp. ADMS]|uniref:ATP-dependent DNA ligase n=1 Tax=Streptomyces sp. ADMS TaxID=3071415 RepID=UPI00296FF81B|nr:ATP-dependent DNA ligase [Streptomyces sp. ADMS]MDW4910429.1 ATP-dependent DNA ligase [Streptomyces sp. ADMS]
MASEDVPVRPPVEVVRPVTARELPAEDHWPNAPTRYEVKADGWRAVAGVIEDHRPVLFSRQGGNLGALFPEVLDELRVLPVGTVLDGELCAVVGERLDFNALARRRGRDRRRWPPVVYLVFDCLSVTGTDLRTRPLQERLDRLGELLRPPPSVIQPVPATTSRSEALTWYAERPYGLEGLVIKGLGTSYAPGRTRWLKIKHVDTVDTEIVAIAGSPARPAYLVVRLPDGTLAQTAQLDSTQRAAVGRALADGIWEAMPGGGHRVATLLLAEVEVGTTRHRTVRFVRLREDLGPPPAEPSG